MVITSDTAKRRDSYHHGDLHDTLLQVGKETIEALGPTKTSLREVARRSNVTPAAVFHHFKDKSSLFAAIAANGFESLIQRRETMVANISDPRARVRLYLRAYVEFAVENPEIFGLMFGPLIAPRANFPQLQETALRSFKVLRHEIRNYLEKQDRPHEDMNAATWAAWSAAHGLSMLFVDFPASADRPDKLSNEKLVTTITDMILAGLVADQDPENPAKAAVGNI